MADHSAIEWTDATWNPTTGCTKISPGCAHCYIERTPAFRIHGRKFVHGATDLQLHADRLDQPLHWRKPRRVFVNSLSDLFHPDVSDAFLHRVYATMEQARWHTFQVLTKRPERMRDYLAWRYGPREDGGGWRIPSRHIWHGVSVENQRFADERIPLLLQTRAAVRFISAEPLLGRVTLLNYLYPSRRAGVDDTDKLDWVIVGGESGPGARPFDVAWARSIVRQCQTAGVPVFVKQLGGNTVETMLGPGGFIEVRDEPLRLYDRKGGDPAEWPVDLRVREYPVPA